MIKKIIDYDKQIYIKFKNNFNMPIEYTHTTDQMDKLEKKLKPFEKYSATISTALKDLINAFNNSKLYSDNLPKFTEYPEFPDLDKLIYKERLPDLPKKSINTDMLNVFLITIEKINELNDKKVNNKYYTELTKLRFNPTDEKSEKIKQVEQFENSQIVRENREKSDQNFKYNTKTEERKTDEEKSAEEFFERVGIDRLLQKSFINDQTFNLIQIYHNVIIKELQNLGLYHFIKLFSKDIKIDKDLIDIYINNIEDRLIKIDNSGLEATERDSYRKILETKLDLFKVQREKYVAQEEKYYNDIYQVFNNLTDLVVYQKTIK
jgi:hypothetical protein